MGEGGSRWVVGVKTAYHPITQGCLASPGDHNNFIAPVKTRRRPTDQLTCIRFQHRCFSRSLRPEPSISLAASHKTINPEESVLLSPPRQIFPKSLTEGAPKKSINTLIAGDKNATRTINCSRRASHGSSGRTDGWVRVAAAGLGLTPTRPSQSNFLNLNLKYPALTLLFL